MRIIGDCNSCITSRSLYLFTACILEVIFGHQESTFLKSKIFAKVINKPLKVVSITCHYLKCLPHWIQFVSLQIHYNVDVLSQLNYDSINYRFDSRSAKLTEVRRISNGNSYQCRSDNELTW